MDPYWTPEGFLGILPAAELRRKEGIAADLRQLAAAGLARAAPTMAAASASDSEANRPPIGIQ